MMITSCSTKKNTGMSRFWHGFTAHYNTYYNGAQAYIDGSLEKEKGNKDNYTERIPLYTVSNKASRELGKSNYEAAITKAQKAIQLHSIKAKPEWTKSRRKTERDIEWLTRKEYNPFLWKAWMLMGRSQFYQGNFDEAAATFSYMSRLYKGQPAIYGKARAWLAKCYLENDWVYDAEDVIRKMQRDSIDWRAQKEWDYTLCDYYLHTGDDKKAALYLRKVIKHEMRSKQRAREYYLLGQIEAAQGNREEAYKAFRKVIAQNPPYELAFNARISMTEVMAKGQAKKMIGRLRRMARDENNKEYLDQVYYAIGNIYLAEKDTTAAIGAYETGNEKSKRAGVEKGVLLLHLGDLYWAKEKYGDAQRVYGEAIGLLDKERPDYKQLAERSKVLDELAPHTDAVYLQDSLQVLAKMPEKQRNEAIDRVIEALKKKEKEEKNKALEAEAEKRQQQFGGNNGPGRKTPAGNNNAANTPATPGQKNNSTWYFYNAQVVMQGKQTFQRTWGRRENVDNWQRNNKTVVGMLENTSEEEKPDLSNLTPEERDSIRMAEEAAEKEKERLDSAVNDPHKREYYMAQIPFTEEQVAASHEIIKDGLFHSGVIFKDKLDNLPLSEKAFARLMKDYPDFAQNDEVYYHMFLLHSRRGEKGKASHYVQKLMDDYPQSKWTTLLTDPYFEDNARYGKHLEDSLYVATYEAFKNDRFAEVYDNAELSEKRFPLGENRDRFIFIKGMTLLNDGNADSCLVCMQKVVSDYPTSPVAEMAGMIINGVKEGRVLHGAKFDLSDVWNRRAAVMEDAEKYAERTFSAEKETDHLFVVAYAPDSLNENQLLFQMARFNFTSFMVRNFDLNIEDHYGMHHLTISGFRSFDEARQYAKIILKQDAVRNAMGNGRPIVISAQNLELIGSRYSYNDYDTFYVNNLAPLPVERPERLYEQVSVKEEKSDNTADDDPIKPVLPTEEVAPNGVKPVDPATESDNSEDNDDVIAIPADTEVVLPAEKELTIPSGEEITVPAEEEITMPAEDNVTIPAEEEITVPVEDSVTVLAEEENTVQAEEEVIVVTDDSSSTNNDDDIIVVTDEAADKGATEDDVIVVEDDKQSSKDLEDEYYELDGF